MVHQHIACDDARVYLDPARQLERRTLSGLLYDLGGLLLRLEQRLNPLRVGSLQG